MLPAVIASQLLGPISVPCATHKRSMGPCGTQGRPRREGSRLAARQDGTTVRQHDGGMHPIAPVRGRAAGIGHQAVARRPMRKQLYSCALCRFRAAGIASRARCSWWAARRSVRPCCGASGRAGLFGSDGRRLRTIAACSLQRCDVMVLADGDPHTTLEITELALPRALREVAHAFANAGTRTCLHASELGSALPCVRASCVRSCSDQIADTDTARDEPGDAMPEACIADTDALTGLTRRETEAPGPRQARLTQARPALRTNMALAHGCCSCGNVVPSSEGVPGRACVPACLGSHGMTC